MTKDDIHEKARARVAEMLGVPIEQVTDEAEFVADLGADSMDSIELTMDIEETFDLEISDHEAAEANTFGRLVAMIVQKLGVHA